MTLFLQLAPTLYNPPALHEIPNFALLLAARRRPSLSTMVSSSTGCVSGTTADQSMQEEVDMELHSTHDGQTQPAAASQLTNRVAQNPTPQTLDRGSTHVDLTNTVGEDHIGGAADGRAGLFHSYQAAGSTSSEVAMAASTDSVARSVSAGDDRNLIPAPGPLVLIGRQPAPASLQSLAVAAAGDTTNHGPAALIDQALPAVQLPRDVHFQEEPVDAVRHRDLIPPDVDLGWGIVVGALSREDFNEILAFPVVCEE